MGRNKVGCPSGKVDTRKVFRGGSTPSPTSIMKDILSGYTQQELEKILNHTDLTMNDVIREKLGLPKIND